MLVIDNFFPKEIIDPVVIKSDKYGWTFARIDRNQDVYWTVIVYGHNNYGGTKNYNTINKFTHQEIKNCWDFIKNKFKKCVSEENLEACYLNGLTHGLEAHAHIDNINDHHFVTIICYVCDVWNSHWCGETCFYNMTYSENPADEVYYSHEIIKAVLPRYNRVVMFDGNTVHSVRPLSKTFKGLRKTLMFKLKNVSIEELKDYAT